MQIRKTIDNFIIQIFPFRIEGMDGIQLLLSGTCFQLFLSSDGITDFLKDFIVDQFSQVVLSRKAFGEGFISVLVHSLHDL